MPVIQSVLNKLQVVVLVLLGIVLIVHSVYTGVCVSVRQKGKIIHFVL